MSGKAPTLPGLSFFWELEDPGGPSKPTVT